MRARLPPSAARTANSLRRATPRDSIRLAAFAQATKSTSPTAPNRTASAGRTSPTSDSLKDASIGTMPWTSPGSRCASRIGAIDRSSAADCASVAPGRIRATRSSSSRIAFRNVGFDVVVCIAATVTQASTPRGYSTSAGITPTIVKG